MTTPRKRLREFQSNPTSSREYARTYFPHYVKGDVSIQPDQ